MFTLHETMPSYIERHIINNNGTLRVILMVSPDSTHLFKDYESCKQLANHKEYRITYVGANAIDFLMNDPMMNPLTPMDELYMSSKGVQLPFKYTLVDDLGIPPYKTRPSDSGFDLNLVGIRKKIGSVTLYGTGVSVEPPSGYYFDMVPRSSIIKSGYMLANSVGIIDQGYTGEIMVPLIKLDSDTPDLQLPCKMVQLIPRKWFPLHAVPADSLQASVRGAGGFGSTNITTTPPSLA